MRLPAALRKRLLEAAQLNALTEIEAVIAELKQGESGAMVRAEELDRLLARYDTDAIIELFAQLGADADRLFKVKRKLVGKNASLYHVSSLPGRA
mgnify:CR=1 FL=1